MQTKAGSKKKTIREEWPIIRVVFKNGKNQYLIDSRKTGYNGKQEFRPTKGEAEKRVREILEDFEQEGTSGGSMDSALRTYAIKADEILKPFGKSVLQAAEHYRDFLQAQLSKENSRFIGELADEWLAFKESGSKQTLRSATIKGIKKGRNFLVNNFKDVRIMSLDANTIEKAIDKNGGATRTRINMLSLVSQFFNWSMEKTRGYCKENPCEDIKAYTAEEREVAILTPERAKNFMTLCESKYSSLTLYHALQLFGGLRPEEARQIQWENISEGFVYVPKSISKVCDDRNAPITPTLKIWLDTFQGKRNGFVTPQTNFVNVLKKFRFDMGYAVMLVKKEKGKSVKIKNEGAPLYPTDCCRHSYASYMLAIGTHKGDLAENMGNSIPVIKKHYKKIVAKKEGEKFFTIVPCQYAEATAVKKNNLRNLIKRKGGK